MGGGEADESKNKKSELRKISSRSNWHKNKKFLILGVGKNNHPIYPGQITTEYYIAEG